MVQPRDRQLEEEGFLAGQAEEAKHDRLCLKNGRWHEETALLLPPPKIPMPACGQWQGQSKTPSCRRLLGRALGSEWAAGAGNSISRLIEL